MQGNQLECLAVDCALHLVDLHLARKHGLRQCGVRIEQRANSSGDLIDDQTTHADSVQAQLRQGAIERLRSVTLHGIGVHDCTLRSAGLSHNGQ
jgi:hypothetical protein